ncbi:HAD family hydrolase [Actinomyces oris]|uniref:HAD family hydrolase n=1 Tax=Actinomyces oris TaxID=544580 RepID=UPI003D34F759
MYPHSSIGFVSGGTVSVQLLSSSGSSTEEPVPLARAEAVLCDMDGTLVDSSAVVESMWSSFAHDHGMSERFDEIMAYSPGRTGLDTIRRFLPELTADEQDAIYKRLAREEIVRTAGRMAEIPGAASFMTALIDAGVPLALVTSAPIELMQVRMEEAGVPIPPCGCLRRRRRTRQTRPRALPQGRRDPGGTDLLLSGTGGRHLRLHRGPARRRTGPPRGRRRPRGRPARPPHRGLHRDHLHHPLASSRAFFA